MHVPAALRGATLETLPCPGDTLAEAMENRSLTPEQLADKIGCPLPEIRSILAGTRHISVDLAERIAEAILPGSADFWIKLQAGWEEASGGTTRLAGWRRLWMVWTGVISSQRFG